MNRVEPTKVAAFFEANPDVKPVRKKFVLFGEDYDDFKGCCGLTSQVVGDEDRDYTLADLDGRNTSNGMAYLLETLRLDPTYALGFVDGWDGLASRMNTAGIPWIRQEYDSGREDGIEAYRLTKRKGLAK